MSVGALDPAGLLRPSVLGVGPYVPGAGARELKQRTGRTDLIRLNWNENLSGPLDGVVEAVTATLADEVWTYPEEAYEEFRRAVAEWAGVDPLQVIPGHGIQALTLSLVAAFVETGDRVVIPRPTYGLYASVCAAAGAIVERVDTDPDTLAFDLEALAARAVELQAKLVFVCDPNNPTGLRVSRADWDAFTAALPERCVVVTDEAYADYIEPDERIDRRAAIAGERPVVVLRTFSKIFGLAGLRLGYLLVHELLAPHLHAVQEPFNVNCAALAAGLASLAARRAAARPPRRRARGAPAAGGAVAGGRDPHVPVARAVRAGAGRRRRCRRLRGAGARGLAAARGQRVRAAGPRARHGRRRCGDGSGR